MYLGYKCEPFWAVIDTVALYFHYIIVVIIMVLNYHWWYNLVNVVQLGLYMFINFRVVS